MLPGVMVRDIRSTVDERGSFAEIMREDWKDILGNDRIVQSNFSISLPGMIRAWHRHSRGQVDYLVVLRGTMKICAYDDEQGSPTKGSLDEIIASETKFQVVRIPGHYWHGTKTLGIGPSSTLYFVSHLYDSKNPDEQRRSWNDPNIINPITMKSFDWNDLPYK